MSIGSSLTGFSSFIISLFGYRASKFGAISNESDGVLAGVGVGTGVFVVVVVLFVVEEGGNGA